MSDEPEEMDDPEDLLEDDIDDLADDDDELVEDDAISLEDEDDEVVELVVIDDEEVAVDPKAAKAEEGDDDEDDEPDDQDVEASLDTILKERLVVEEIEDDEDTPEIDDRSGDGLERVLPKQPDEFVCQSCFLVKHPSQLADRKKKLCRDCV